MVLLHMRHGPILQLSNNSSSLNKGSQDMYETVFKVIPLK